MAPTNLVRNGRYKHICCVVWVVRKLYFSIVVVVVFVADYGAGGVTSAAVCLTVPLSLVLALLCILDLYFRVITM